MSGECYSEGNDKLESCLDRKRQQTDSCQRDGGVVGKLGKKDKGIKL